MSPHSRDMRPRDPEQVSVSCCRCGRSFTTDESSAYQADQRDGGILCTACKGGGQAPPSQADLEEPPVDDVRDDVGVGPDAEPDIEATIPDAIGFNELCHTTAFNAKLTRGTKQVGTITVDVGEPDDIYLPVHLDPDPVVLSDEAAEAIVSTLSCRTNLLIDVQ